MSVGMHCICLCKYLHQCLCVFDCVSVPECGNELHKKSKKETELWPRVFNIEMESSSRSAEVIMDRSLAKLQLQVTQLTSDPASPKKNEPVHRPMPNGLITE